MASGLSFSFRRTSFAILIANEVLRKEKDNPEAKKILEEVFRRRKEEMAAVLYNEAVDSFKMKKTEEAYSQISQTVMLVPDNKDYQQIYDVIKAAWEKRAALALCDWLPTKAQFVT